MNLLIQKLIQNLKKQSKLLKIVFPEGNNEIIQKVAKKLTEEKLADCSLIFDKNEKNFPRLSSKIKIIKINDFPKINELTQNLFQIRKGKMSFSDCFNLIQKTNYFAMMMLYKNQFDCFLGGIEYNTSDILRPAFQIIKTVDPLKPATSTCLMLKNEESMFFADCALTLNPNVFELINIAENTIVFANQLNFEEKKVALLSFSTCGSNKTTLEILTKVQKATKILKNKNLFQTNFLGEVQFDAAFSERVRNKKVPNDQNVFKGKANIFIFPDLNSANIGYKIAQNLGNYKVIGPIILGLNKVVNDLSRGATFDDVYQTAIITLNQALRKQAKK